MGQEDAEKKISYDCLRTIVEDAIKTKNICTIETIGDENQLRYMQKYAELLVSKHESKISFKSYFVGMDSVILATLAIGISYFLFGILKNPMFEVMSYFLGILIITSGVWLYLWKKPKSIKEFENINKDIEFVHEIILKIEEKLLNRT